LAEHGFFATEMNTGWAEWKEAGLPTHGERELAHGTVRCTCSLGAEGSAEAGAPAPH